MPNRDGTGPAKVGEYCARREQIQGEGGQHGECRSQGRGISKPQDGNRAGCGAEKRRGRK